MSNRGICSRCGREAKIEKHHIVGKIDGGLDRDSNLANLCVPCHKFTHAERRILKDIERLVVHRCLLRHRLEILRKFNTPKLIKERGTYKSYWKDEATH